MKALFWKMDYDAWDVGTVDLPLEQEAAYLRLCNQMYRAKGPIPNSTKLLQALFRCGHTRARALADALISAGKIEVREDGLLSNPRVMSELSERGALSAIRASVGSEGGRKSRPQADQSSTTGRPNPDQPPTKGRAKPDQLPTNDRPTADNPLKYNRSSEANASGMFHREEKRRGEQSSPAGAPAHEGPLPEGAELEAVLRRASGLEGDPNPGLMVLGPIHALIDEGFDLQRHILPVLRELAARGVRWKTWQYVVERVRDKNTAPPRPRIQSGGGPVAVVSSDPKAYLDGLSDDRWRAYVRRWKSMGGTWDLNRRTPAPDRPGTAVPVHILAEFGLTPAADAAQVAA